MTRFFNIRRTAMRGRPVMTCSSWRLSAGESITSRSSSSACCRRWRVRPSRQGRRSRMVWSGAAMNPREPFRPFYRGVAPGTRLNGIYEIDQMIGAGGMGGGCKCHEIQTGAVVAIKMLLPEMAESEAALALFRREAAALHHLLHDAIVRYFVFSVEPALQRPYLAMEFVDGQSLSEILANGPLTFEAL